MVQRHRPNFWRTLPRRGYGSRPAHKALPPRTAVTPKAAPVKQALTVSSAWVRSDDSLLTSAGPGITLGVKSPKDIPPHRAAVARKAGIQRSTFGCHFATRSVAEASGSLWLGVKSLDKVGCPRDDRGCEIRCRIASVLHRSLDGVSTWSWKNCDAAPITGHDRSGGAPPLLLQREGSGPISRVLSLQAGDGHSSRRCVAAPLKLPTRTLTGGHRTKDSYLALLRVGFTLPSHITAPAVRSYRTFSPSPGSLSQESYGRAVCFLWHFPSGHPAWPLASTLPAGARTFLPHLLQRRRPSGPLPRRACSTEA